MERNPYLERTVTTNADLPEELLRAVIGDPYSLIIPHPVGGPGYWGTPDDHGIDITDKDDQPKTFILWADLREIVYTVGATRIHSDLQAGMQYRDRVIRNPAILAGAFRVPPSQDSDDTDAKALD